MVGTSHTINKNISTCIFFHSTHGFNFFFYLELQQKIARKAHPAHGVVTFISSLYSGCMSDIEITKNYGLIELLEPGYQIMADKGFVLNKLLEGTEVTIATLHFLRSD